MDKETKTRGGIMSKLTDVIRNILSDSVAGTTERVERAIAMDNWQSQIWRGVFEYDDFPEFDFWPHDIFFDDGGDVFAVAVSNGSLFRVPVDTSDPENVTVGEPTEVVVDFTPVARTGYVKRNADGRYHGLAILCSAALDKDSEIDSRALFDTFVERFQGGEYVNIYHLGGDSTAVGHFDYLAREDNMLIAHYVLDDTPIARAVGETLAERGDDWGWSIEYDPDNLGHMTEVAPGMSVRVFDSGDLLGASILRTGHACAWFTGQTTTRMQDDMNDTTRSAIAELLGGNDELLNEFEQMVDNANARAATAITRESTEAEDESDGDDRIAVLQADINALTERLDSFVAPTTELIAQDIELDDTVQEAIVDRLLKVPAIAAMPLEAGAAMEKVGELSDQIATLTDGLTERVKKLEDETNARLESVERTDAEKIAEHDDLKPSQSPLIRVGVRPREANAGERAPINMASAAEERLAKMNTGKRNVA